VKEEEDAGKEEENNKSSSQTERGTSSSHPGLPEKPNNEYSSSDSWFHLFDSKVQGPGRVAYLGSSSNFNLLVQNENEPYHYSLPTGNSGKSRLGEMDKEEVDILKIRGAFLLPSRELCDDIVESYFEKVHPIIPVINRTLFMRQYNDPTNPPSLLLLQAVLLCGSRVCQNPGLKDATGSSELASLTFYKRAKALYDANYELDRISLVQSTLLMGWWWENPEEITKNVYYWTGVSICIAQGFGLHRSVEHSNMSVADRKMWKRIWWSLFVRDRQVAVALGRPLMINLDDSDVPMLTEEDLNEDEPGKPSMYPTNRVHALYFIHSVKLCEIIGYVLKQQFSIGAEKSRRQNKRPSISYCDMAMASWMKNLPEELKYSVGDIRNHDFLKALLHSTYYTTLCLVHRSNVTSREQGEKTASSKDYPSWGIAFQAAHMICMIADNLLKFDELKDCPAFIVYTLFSAMIILLYQTESRSKTAAERARKAIQQCVTYIDEVGKTWIVARKISRLFRQIKDNPKIKEKIVSAAKEFSASTSSAAAGMSDRELKRRFGNYYEDENDNPAKRAKATVPNNNLNSTVDPNSTSKSSAPPPPPPSFPPFPAPDSPQPQRSPNEPAAQKQHSAAQNLGGPSPEFYFVTNSSPGTQKGFCENFQPSQLFPEVQDGLYLGGLSSNSTTPNSNKDGPTAGPSNSNGTTHAMADHSPSTAAASLGLSLSPTATTNDAGSSSVPNSLSFGEWYQFLMDNTDGKFPLGNDDAISAAVAPPKGLSEDTNKQESSENKST
jgi:hypothetical protein